jgi:hypothetical protein
MLGCGMYLRRRQLLLEVKVGSDERQLLGNDQLHRNRSSEVNRYLSGDTSHQRLSSENKFWLTPTTIGMIETA